MAGSRVRGEGADLEEPEFTIEEAVFDIPRETLTGVVHRRVELLAHGPDEASQLFDLGWAEHPLLPGRGDGHQASSAVHPELAAGRRLVLREQGLPAPVQRDQQRLRGLATHRARDPFRRAHGHEIGAPRDQIGRYQHSGLLHRHAPLDQHGDVRVLRVVDDRSSPRERPLRERRRPHLLDRIQDVREASEVRQRQVETGPAELGQVFHVRIATNERSERTLRPPGRQAFTKLLHERRVQLHPQNPTPEAGETITGECVDLGRRTAFARHQVDVAVEGDHLVVQASPPLSASPIQVRAKHAERQRESRGHLVRKRLP